MTTPQGLLKSFEEGRLTLDGLFLNVLSVSSRQVLGEILESWPPELLDQLRGFAEDYRPRARVFRGPRPRMEYVRLLREWLGRRRVAKANRDRPEMSRP
jgi:hypothetical protein